MIYPYVYDFMGFYRDLNSQTLLGSLWGMIWGAKCLLRRCLGSIRYNNILWCLWKLMVDL